MRIIFLSQLIVPLLFIGWIGFAPARSVLGFCTQTLSVAVALFALRMIGLWLFPPWWAAWVFAGLLLAASIKGWRQRVPFKSTIPSGWLAWLSTGLFAALGIWGAYQSILAIKGRAQQPGPIIDLAFPLKAGDYLIVNGGSNIVLNAHLMTLDPGIERFHPYKGQSYGLDIVKLDKWGLRASGLLPSNPADYVVFGTPVYSPCTGKVIAAFDAVQDMQVPQMDRQHMAGNYVMLRCGKADVVLGHLQRSSVSVTPDAQVSAGQFIAKVGNSGNTGEPHLHVHAQLAGTADAPFSGEPLSTRFDGRFLVRNDRLSRF